MRLTFVETHRFRMSSKNVLSDDDLRALGDLLLAQPAAGDLVPRTGGARKIRVPLGGRGKRGGARVVYFYHEAAGRIYYLLVYPKNVAVSLSEAGKQQMQVMLDHIKREG